MPILSICIPTFNRATFLAETLNAITNQLNEVTHSKVQLVISDNASIDNTEQLVADFITNHPQIQVIYFRQLSNLGGDSNVNTVISLATGEFVYILSDDDILLPEAINRIFSLIDANPSINAFCLNMVTFANTLTEISPPIFKVTQDYIIYNQDEALLFLGTWITFLSTVVFKKHLIIEKNYTNKLAIGFIHSHVFLDVLTQSKFYITSQPFLAVRGGNTGGYNFFKVFVTSFAEMLNYAKELGYSQSAIKQVLSKHRHFIYSFILTFKIHGGYGQLQPDYKDGLNRLVRAYYNDPIFLLGMILLIAIPQFLFQYLYRIHKLRKKR